MNATNEEKRGGVAHPSGSDETWRVANEKRIKTKTKEDIIYAVKKRATQTKNRKEATRTNERPPPPPNQKTHLVEYHLLVRCRELVVIPGTQMPRPTVEYLYQLRAVLDLVQRVLPDAVR